jgi:hypothetical protein
MHRTVEHASHRAMSELHAHERARLSRTIIDMEGGRETTVVDEVPHSHSRCLYTANGAGALPPSTAAKSAAGRARRPTDTHDMSTP